MVSIIKRVNLLILLFLTYEEVKGLTPKIEKSKMTNTASRQGFTVIKLSSRSFILLSEKKSPMKTLYSVHVHVQNVYTVF